MEKTFTTARGVLVEFVGIAPLLDKLNQDRVLRLPQAPTYSITNALGGTEVHEHYQKWVEVKELDDNGDPTGKEISKEETSLSTDEERAAWTKYQADLQRTNAEFSERLIKTALLFGLRLDKAQYESGAWVKRQEFVGIQVPADPIERELHWLQTEVVGNKDEAGLLIVGVLTASGTDEEVVSAMEDRFRNSLGRSNGNTSKGSSNSNGRESLVPVGTL